MNKLICKVIGHKIKTEKCPVTEAKLSFCVRCSHPHSLSKMSFN